MPIIRPKIKLLDEDHKRMILEEAKTILETQGVFIENHEAISLFNQHGINNDGSRFFIPPDLIDNCLKTVPSEITLYDRDGDKYISLKEDNVNFDPGSAAIFILDEHTGDIREGESNDFVRFSRIVEQLKYIDAQSTALIYNDVPKEAQDWHRLYLALSNCYKPVVTGTFRKESFSVMREILLACRLSEDDLATASIDSSDGLAKSLKELIFSNPNVGIEINHDTNLYDEEVLQYSEEFGISLDKLVFEGGEEFIHLFTIRPEDLDLAQKMVQAKGGKLFKIGKVISDKNIYILKDDEKYLETFHIPEDYLF